MHKSAFTNFELATGSHFEAMYGMFSDYDEYVIIKGMKFASVDGIYAAGFLIVNKKFLVLAKDIWAIVLMKLIRVRFKKLYIFKLSGTTVQQTALLVYPIRSRWMIYYIWGLARCPDRQKILRRFLHLFSHGANHSFPQ